MIFAVSICRCCNSVHKLQFFTFITDIEEGFRFTRQRIHRIKDSPHIAVNHCFCLNRTTCHGQIYHRGPVSNCWLRRRSQCTTPNVSMTITPLLSRSFSPYYYAPLSRRAALSNVAVRLSVCLSDAPISQKRCSCRIQVSVNAD